MATIDAARFLPLFQRERESKVERQTQTRTHFFKIIILKDSKQSVNHS